jgi:hypothetical protein
VRLDVERELRLLDRLALVAGAEQHLGELEADGLHARGVLLQRHEAAVHAGERLRLALRRVDVAERSGAVSSRQSRTAQRDWTTWPRSPGASGSRRAW